MLYSVQSKGKAELEVHLYYNRGGINSYTLNTEKRGYYLSVTTKGQDYDPTAIKVLIHEVDRKSKSATIEAAKKLTDENGKKMIHNLITIIAKENNWSDDVAATAISNAIFSAQQEYIKMK
jgi:hypothetical protein